MTKMLAPDARGDRFLEERWAGTLLAFSALAALIVTLYPYDFYFADAVLPRFLSFDEEFAQPDLWGDAARNVLLFIPFGFAVSCLVVGKSPRMLPLWCAGLLSGAALSAGIEFTQVLLPVRQPAFADIISNSLGAMLGALAPPRLRRQVLCSLSALAGKIRAGLSVKILLAATGLYLLLLFGAALHIQNAARITNWDTGFPLALGNERTGDRPWSGEITELSFFDRAATGSDVAQLFSTGERSALPRNSLLASVTVGADGEPVDETGRLPRLHWQGRRVNAAEPGEKEFRLGPDRWLRTNESLSYLAGRIEQTSEFTIMISLRSASARQSGPARIVSISDSPGSRNLTVAQDGSDLVIRLRTPLTGENGNKPSLLFPGVLGDTLAHKLAITYKPPFLRVYADEAERVSTAALTPDMAFIRQAAPVRHWRLHIDRLSIWIYSVLNYAFALLPLAFLLTLLLFAGRRPSIRMAPFCLGAAVLSTALIEEIAVGWGVPRPGNILLSLVITAAGVVVFNRWLKWLLPVCRRQDG